MHRFDSGCIAALRQVLQHCLFVVDEKNREYIKALVRTVPGAWPKCQHAEIPKGCTEDFDGVLVACYFPNYDTDGGDQSQGCPPDEWYCPQHAPIHGYCACCDVEVKEYKTRTGSPLTLAEEEVEIHAHIHIYGTSEERRIMQALALCTNEILKELRKGKHDA